MATDDRLTVILKLDGPLVDEHRLPLSDLKAMADEQSAAPYATPDLGDPWRDDEEAAALIAAIHQEGGGHA